MDANPAPRIEGVLETILYVEDLARTTAFYRDVLGLRPMTGDPRRFQAFEAGPGRVLLLFVRGATLAPLATAGGVIPPHDGSGPQHLAFAIAAADCGPWRERLRARGIALESEVAWERGGRSLYCRDPDGHLVELATPGLWPNY